MGIQTTSPLRMSSTRSDGRPFEPYNPALILGGLRARASPRSRWPTPTRPWPTTARSSAARWPTPPTGPIGIQKVQDPGRTTWSRPTTASPGQDKVETKQVVPPDVAATARTILHSVVTSGTGTNAYTGDPTEWGKTGTTENNGDAWFVGATQDITVAVWVGHADSVKPMLTEYGGAPVDGGTIPALIFNEIVNAYDQLKASEKAPAEEPSSDRRRRPVPTPGRSRAFEHRPAPQPQPSRRSRPAAAASRRQPRASRLRPPARAAAARHPAAAPAAAASPASAAGRSAQRPRQVLAAGGAEAPGKLDAARLMPIRGPVATRDLAPAVVAAAQLERAARSSGARFISSPIPSASVSLPGPRAQLAHPIAAAAPATSPRSPSAAPAPGSAPRPPRPRARRRS